MLLDNIHETSCNSDMGGIQQGSSVREQQEDAYPTQDTSLVINAPSSLEGVFCLSVGFTRE